MLDRVNDPSLSCGNAASPELRSQLQRSQHQVLQRSQERYQHPFDEVIEREPSVQSLIETTTDRGHSQAFPKEDQSGVRLVIAHVVEGSRGGVGVAVRHLIEEQARDPLITNIHLLADPERMGEMLSDIPAEFHWYRSSRSPRRLLSVSQDVQKKLAQLRPDIVYLHSTFPGVYGRITLKRSKATWATLYCPHGWAFSQSVAYHKRWAYSLVERLLAHRADAIVSVSRDELEQATRRGIRHERHRVIPHGIPARARPALPALVHRGNQVNVLFVGRFDHQKGVDLLLDAWADPRLENFHLWLIGDSTLGHSIKIKPAPNIHQVGWVKNDLIDSYIRSCDAVILPSRWEAFGLVALEAMRNGRAVLASRVGGLPELVIDRVNGVLFQPGSREDIVQAVAGLDKGQLARMGEMGGRVFHAGFEWQSCYSQWKRLADDLIQERRSEAEPKISGDHSRTLHQCLKRLMDMAASSVLILTMLPILLAIAMAIKFTSRGPILFGHKRCGRDGKMFRVWKFRTMVLDADRLLEEYLRSSPDAMNEWTRTFKLRKDPRVTAVGRFLRRYSLDEIPQLVNVLIGTMSLVGPRPIVQKEVDRYADAYHLYKRVKPGITGLWQISGRNDTTYAQRVECDTSYVRNWSIWLDLFILWKTLYVVMAARGSY